MSPLFGTGAFPSRPIRSSQLLFGWRARDLSLTAYTGQVGSQVIVGAPAAMRNTYGRNGAYVPAGHGMSRFEQVAAQGLVPRLNLVGSGISDGGDIERVEFPWPLQIMSMSIYQKVWPGWAAGVDTGFFAYGLQLGTALSGGNWSVGRVGTTWQAQRTRSAVTISTNFVEPGATVYPIEVLTTLSAGGQLTLSTRDGAGTPVIRNGTTTPTDANMAITTESWGDSVFYVGANGVWSFEEIKIARGVQSFAQMDLLH